MNREEATAEAKRRWGKWGRAWIEVSRNAPTNPIYYRVGIGMCALGLSEEGFKEAFESQLTGGLGPRMSDDELVVRYSPPDLDFQYEMAVERVRAAIEAARSIAPTGQRVWASGDRTATAPSNTDVIAIAALILGELKKS